VDTTSLKTTSHALAGHCLVQLVNICFEIVGKHTLGTNKHVVVTPSLADTFGPPVLVVPAGTRPGERTRTKGASKLKSSAIGGLRTDVLSALQ
jgi:hypothetical protein